MDIAVAVVEGDEDVVAERRDRDFALGRAGRVPARVVDAHIGNQRRGGAFEPAPRGRRGPRWAGKLRFMGGKPGPLTREEEVASVLSPGSLEEQPLLELLVALGEA